MTYVNYDTNSRNSTTVTFNVDMLTGKSERVYSKEELISPFYPCSNCLNRGDEEQGAFVHAH